MNAKVTHWTSVRPKVAPLNHSTTLPLPLQPLPIKRKEKICRYCSLVVVTRVLFVVIVCLMDDIQTEFRIHYFVCGIGYIWANVDSFGTLSLLPITAISVYNISVRWYANNLTLRNLKQLLVTRTNKKMPSEWHCCSCPRFVLILPPHPWSSVFLGVTYM